MVLGDPIGEPKPLLAGGSGDRPPFLSLDGFPFKPTNKLTDPNLTINTWSHWGVTKLQIAFDDILPANITHKGKTIRVLDYKLFTGMIGAWMRDKNYPLTKEKALDTYFEIGG